MGEVQVSGQILGEGFMFVLKLLRGIFLNFYSRLSLTARCRILTHKVVHTLGLARGKEVTTYPTPDSEAAPSLVLPTTILLIRLLAFHITVGKHLNVILGRLSREVCSLRTLIA